METLDPGTPFGPYTIEGLIAGGGMGAVYAARHTVYGSACALKVLHASLQPDDDWRRRFHAEGIVGVALKHPNVLAAREVLIGDDGQIGLVLDLVREGLTLHRVMTREFSTGLPLVQALRAFLGIVQGIDYAHEKDVVHGDIKPENVLIQGDFRDPDTWVPMVTDFGTVGILAHPVVIDGMQAVVVSPRYASPEHLKGMRYLEPRSDLYCLGLLLHYLLTGEHASSARSVEEAAQRVVKPVPTTALVDQPEALVALFQKATAFKPKDRFQTARELALAVRDLLESLGEGLELDDLQADLATEIMEGRREAARKKRHEARRAAAAAAEGAVDGDAGGAGEPDGDETHVPTQPTPPPRLDPEPAPVPVPVPAGAAHADPVAPATAGAAEHEPETAPEPAPAPAPEGAAEPVPVPVPAGAPEPEPEPVASADDPIADPEPVASADDPTVATDPVAPTHDKAPVAPTDDPDDDPSEELEEPPPSHDLADEDEDEPDSAQDRVPPMAGPEPTLASPLPELSAPEPTGGGVPWWAYAAAAVAVIVGAVALGLALT